MQTTSVPQTPELRGSSAAQASATVNVLKAMRHAADDCLNTSSSRRDVLAGIALSEARAAVAALIEAAAAWMAYMDDPDADQTIKDEEALLDRLRTAIVSTGAFA